MSNAVDDIKVLVEEFHVDHNVGGSSLTCVQCVIAALNKIEFDLQNRIKDKFDGA